MKKYTVYYIIKRDGHGYLRWSTIDAENQKTAIKRVKDSVKLETGRTAFRATCKEPASHKQGLLFDGMIYTRYNKESNRLW